MCASFQPPLAAHHRAASGGSNSGDGLAPDKLALNAVKVAARDAISPVRLVASLDEFTDASMKGFYPEREG
jgi:hypothetical protein